MLLAYIKLKQNVNLKEFEKRSYCSGGGFTTTKEMKDFCLSFLNNPKSPQEIYCSSGTFDEWSNGIEGDCFKFALGIDPPAYAWDSNFMVKYFDCKLLPKEFNKTFEI